LGGGILFLDPTSFDGTQDQADWRRHFESLIPLLKQQPYLDEVRIHEGEAFDIDLDAYLHTTHATPGDRVTIAANHFIGLGLDAPQTISPWLVADSLSTSYPIVIHRSSRYHGSEHNRRRYHCSNASGVDRSEKHEHVQIPRVVRETPSVLLL
jgi:hypothetical protein